jgi:hypothetical protein
MGNINWSHKTDIDKEEVERIAYEEKKKKFKGKSFNTLSTQEKWELLEILAKQADLL